MKHRSSAAALLTVCSGAMLLSSCSAKSGTASPDAAENSAEVQTERTVTDAAAETQTETAVTTAAPAAAPADTENAYVITRVNGSQFDWETIPKLTLDNILWEPDCGIRADAQLASDGEHLYVHLSAAETNIRAEYTEPLSPVGQDSCLEFFFMPADGDRYFNFEMNPNGCLYIGCGHNRNDHITLYRGDMTDYFQIRTNRTADGWEVFYQIPAEFIRVFYPDFQFTGALRANFYKCGDKTVQKHYLSWHPVLSEKPDYHRPQDFGTLVVAES